METQWPQSSRELATDGESRAWLFDAVERARLSAGLCLSHSVPSIATQQEPQAPSCLWSGPKAEGRQLEVAAHGGREHCQTHGQDQSPRKPDAKTAHQVCLRVGCSPGEKRFGMQFGEMLENEPRLGCSVGQVDLSTC